MTKNQHFIRKSAVRDTAKKFGGRAVGDAVIFQQIGPLFTGYSRELLPALAPFLVLPVVFFPHFSGK